MADSTNTNNNAMRTERSGSTSSTGSSPRRASNGWFESLNAQKRKDDPISVARRRSMSEQRPKVGFFGQMWNNYVHGSDPKSNK
ncbi:hypothetical protein QBC33DRAFT_557798 [Phialemonium atrogriseum]|uniref:Conidiation-specific protein 8 n=1 Tax=Phialemonium atrogriseum TaxID=1093897 RepID=A0AAJ0C429_9PEZI|nr:uncharacterized protein QBC33DRAFT_557798 [Phialemonium atrogriseum]KAK1768334.1 hypothetical protein QBC33DRAFT_557798 [Phialemonium atrogriseum]